MSDEKTTAAFLRNNPEFLNNWLSKHGTAEHLQHVAKRLEDNDATEKSDITLALPSFSQVARNSITSSIFKKYLIGDRNRKTSVRKDRSSLCHMSEEELFMELIRDIASELDVNVLCHKILQNVSILTNSDRGSLFLVRGTRDSRYLVSKLFDVTNISTLEESIHTEENEIKVPFGKGIAGHVAQTKEIININNAYEDPRFNQEVDKRTGYKTHAILCMPIINYEGEVIGVAQIINKLTGNHEFSKADEQVFGKYLTFCGIGITNAQLFEMSVNEFKRNQLLLHLARGIFSEQTNLEKLVEKVMLDAQDLLKCERCSVYLLENSFENARFQINPAFPGSRTDPCPPPSPAATSPLPNNETLKEQDKEDCQQDMTFSMAFYLDAKDKEKIKTPGKQELSESRTAQIAQFVVANGKSVNISDLELDGRFGEGPFVEADGFHTRSILCMPIFNSDTKIIGVTCLMNKENGTPFNENDEGIIEAFSIFTGLGIHNCQMYENACRLMAKQTVALEILSYHATAQKEETEKLLKSTIPSAEQLHLYSFDFNDMHLDDYGTLKAVIRMFQEANIISTFKVPYEVVCRWACSVKKNYRPVTYHNWRHAFNVCQTMFTMLYTGEMSPRFDILDMFALMVACLCHDLDHRGTNNAFQVTVASPLAMLYSTSVLEHHHFDHCIMILNSEGNNIFQGLSPEDYKRAIHTLEHAILSTDLAIYFKKRGEFQSLVEQGERKFEDDEKKDLLKGMMMTACDVAAITKPWEIQQEIAQLVAGEFFEQGDIEKTQLGKKPLPMMDRDKKDELPKMQVGFIDAICLPVYKMFAEQWPRLHPLLDGCSNNRQRWCRLTQDGEDNDSSKKTETKESIPEKESEVVPVQTSDKEVKTSDVDHKNTSDSSKELIPVQQNGAVTTQTSQNIPEKNLIKQPSVASSGSRETNRKDMKHSELDHSRKHKGGDSSRTYSDVRKNGDAKTSKGPKSGFCVVS
ncbi:cGMP-specific 3',5'-cyclic phosphodiesterase-like isoform X2 [Gigantopelta aegis]|uniref:cGMP-specific 3',5'-cyclic phosphodiesterase-like isoform X2 n=1 Tax=Gigantopelta aegis TaxID=1735272 RepID=UPI001B88D7A2|nr:cGMP-specific 3',5'-cyclic phosphodiesterase-like isoform X2 [Gigantopelta aegis]